VPKVSVIIPVYNAEMYLRQCLDSVVNQTLSNLEIICIDDGSTDNSPSILDKYAQNDSRIKILQKEHTNAGDTRNLGLEHATGDYVYFLDADDFLETDALQKLCKRAAETDSDIVVFQNKILNQKSNIFSPCDWAESFIKINNYSVFNKNCFNKDFFNFCNIPAWTKFYRRSFLLKNHIEFQGIETCNDVYFNILSLSLAEKITAIPEELIIHRIGHSCLTADRFKHIECILAAFKKTKQELKKRKIFKEAEQPFYVKFNQMFNYELRQISDAKMNNKWKRKLLKNIPNKYKNSNTKRNKTIIIKLLEKFKNMIQLYKQE